MPSIIAALKKYLPDKTVLDLKTPFDDDISAPLFHKGGSVGCITLHGIGGTPANIRVVADALIEKGYTVLSPTLPGHRETVRALNASTGDEWEACVLSAYDRLQAEGCEKIFALGLSLGGVLSCRLAEQRTLDGLVMICAPLKMQRFLRFARLISPILPFVSYQSGNAEPKWRTEPYAQMYDGFSTKKLVDLTRLERKLIRNLNRVTCPTLVISAAYDDKVDPVSVDIFRKKATNVPYAEYVMFASSPHGCTYGPEKEAVAACAADFVTRQVDKGASSSV